MMCLFLLVDLVELSTFSGFSCMQSSGLKISHVPLFGWTRPSSGLSQWELQAPGPGEGCEGGRKLRKRRVFLPHIHSKPEQLKLAGLPFFAALLSSVHIALSQPLRQHGMYGEPGMPEGTYLYNCIKDHFVFYEILSRGFVF